MSLGKPAGLSNWKPDSGWRGLSRQLCWLTTLTTSVSFQVTAYKAGHVLGAAMFMVEIAGLRVLYTGDYSRLPDRHLPGAETPPEPPHICEFRCKLRSGFWLPDHNCTLHLAQKLPVSAHKGQILGGGCHSATGRICTDQSGSKRPKDARGCKMPIQVICT